MCMNILRASLFIKANYNSNDKNIKIMNTILIIMLEFAGSYGEEGLELNFVDLVSPKEWENEIEGKLAAYKEEAHVEDKGNLNLFIVLKLDPSDDEIDDIRYITRHINEFTNFYQSVINEIKG